MLCEIDNLPVGRKESAHGKDCAATVMQLLIIQPAVRHIMSTALPVRKCVG